MKSLFSTLGAFFVVVTTLNAQAISLSNTENYIHTKTYQKAGASASENVHVIEQVSYFDGLGRPKQQIAIKATPDKKDIITHIEYDGFGRQTKDYLPIKTSGTLGSFRTGNMHTATQQYYKTNYAEDFPGVALPNINAYSERIYEASPLNRVLKTGAPGKDWKISGNTDHSIKFDYSSNSATEVVRFDVSLTTSGVPSLKKNGNYKANTLFKNITKDENWKAADGKNHTTEEFTNLQGQVILKRTYNEGVAHDTYYVYDDFGNLTYVLPPKVDASKPVTASILKDLCYQYQYDQRNRLVNKKIPGKGRDRIIYNKLDQRVMTQTSNQIEKAQWSFTKHDVFGRIVYTGVWDNFIPMHFLISSWNSTTSHQYEEKLDIAIKIDNVKVNYSNESLPKTGDLELHTVNYYDDYVFDKPAHTVPTSVFGQSVAKGIETKSLVTGNKVRVLGTDKWISTITYYDKKGRPIYTFSKNEYLQSTDITRIQYDFVGRVLKTELKHKYKSNATITTLDTFTYDHQGRLLTQHQKINNGVTELIASNSYDDLGQLEKKAVGNTKTKPLQIVDYKYNVRGWLKEINDPLASLGNDLFAFKINYNTTSLYQSVELFNGNISETHWKSKSDNLLRSYRYNYDPLNRLLAGVYFSDDDRHYSTDVKYDKMGNIEKLNRIGNIPSTSSYTFIDFLDYKYDNGNKLLSVTDATPANAGFIDGNTTGNDYAYDANGNMIEDKNKGIKSIEYNHLNLPIRIDIKNQGVLEYVYDALGNKLIKFHPGGRTSYAGNYNYLVGRRSSESLQFINQPEGYVEPKNSSDLSKGFNYIYQYKDHLGNIRLSYADTNADGKVDKSEIREEKNYYPFGLTHKGYNNTIRGRKHNYGYNGKEENDELGLGQLDYGARMYDPALGRWFVVDALADDIMQIDKSPYAYSWNSPISLNDPDGNCPWCGGFVVGALSEYAVQVTVNLAKGQSLKDAAFNNVDFVDVGAGGIEGALTLGASAARRISVRIATEVVKASVDVNGNGSKDVIGTDGSTKTATSLVVDTAIGVLGAEGGDKLAKGITNASSDAAVKTAKSNVTAASKNLDKANNIVFNGGGKGARGSSAKSVSQAFTSFTAAKEAQATTQALNSTVGQVSETTIKETTGTLVGAGSTVVADEAKDLLNKTIP